MRHAYSKVGSSGSSDNSPSSPHHHASSRRRLLPFILLVLFAVLLLILGVFRTQVSSQAQKALHDTDLSAVWNSGKGAIEGWVADVNDYIFDSNAQEDEEALMEAAEEAQDKEMYKSTLVQEEVSSMPSNISQKIFESQCTNTGFKWVLNQDLANSEPGSLLENFEGKFKQPPKKKTNFDSNAGRALFARTPIPMHCPTNPQLQYRFFCHANDREEYRRVWDMQNYRLESCTAEPITPFDAEAFVKKILDKGGMVISGDSLTLQQFVTIVCALGEHLELHVRDGTRKWKLSDPNADIRFDADVKYLVLRLRRTSTLWEKYSFGRSIQIEKSTLPPGENAESLSLDVISYIRDDALVNLADHKLNLFERIRYPDPRFRAIRSGFHASLLLSAGLQPDPSPVEKYTPPEPTAKSGRLDLPTPRNVPLPPIRSYGFVVVNTGAHWITRALDMPEHLVIQTYQDMINEWRRLFASASNATSFIVRTSPSANVRCEYRNKPAAKIDYVNKIQWNGPTKTSFFENSGTRIRYDPKEYDNTEHASNLHDSQIRIASNSLWKQAIDTLHEENPSTSSNVHLQDIAEISFLRPDAHAVWVSDSFPKVKDFFAPKKDCTHYCMGSGVLEEWTRSLWDIVRLTV